MAAVVASTVARVKRLVPIDPGEGSKDTLLGDLLAAVSREIEHFLGYEFERKQRTEIYNPKLHDRVVLLRAVPLVTVDSVKVAGDQDFAGADALVVGEDYRVVTETGTLSFADDVLIEGVGTLQVTYTAGFAVDTTAFIAAAPDIAYAVDLQTAEEYRRSTAPSTQVRPGPRGPRSFSSAHGFIPRVEEILAHHRRVLVPNGLPGG